MLGDPEGGLWIKAEIGDDVPLENIEAVYCALEKYSDINNGMELART